MLYPSNAFSIHPDSATIVRKLDSQPYINNSSSLSTGDIATLNYLYGNTPISIFARLRKEFAYINEYDYERRVMYDVFIDFFSDPLTTTTSVSLTSPISLNILNSFYNNNYTNTYNYSFTIPSGVSSFKLFSGVEEYILYDANYEQSDFLYETFQITTLPTGYMSITPLI